MMPFEFYARYYDLLYRDKDYRAEADYVSGLIREWNPAAGTLLELGCGTGGHAGHFAALGYRVHGVDLSASMVEQAVKKAESHPPAIRGVLNFSQGDIRSARLGKTFDAVISLFHVMSYQTTNADLRAAIRTASAHLVPGGVFYFDFWYGPAVLTDRPAVRIKRMEDDAIRVTRLTEPGLETDENVVNVHYEVLIEKKTGGELMRVVETHRMRYLFLPELEGMLQSEGFVVKERAAWMSREAPSDGTWYAGVLCQKT